MDNKKVLFLDYCNMFEGKNPIATLIEIPKKYSIKDLNKLESKQIGVHRIGGSWKHIMRDGKIDYNVISRGKRDQYKPEEYDEVYKLISGNY